MELTINYLKLKFNKYNNLYFDGKLCNPKFEINNSKHQLGCYVSHRFKSAYDYSIIKISKYYDRSEHDIDNTLIHEMIHLYQKQFDTKDKNHGSFFKSECRRINKFGWNLKATDSKSYKVSQTHNYNIFIYKRKSSNNYFLFSVSDNKINFYKNYLKEHDYKYNFFESNNSDLFDSMPKCRSRIIGKIITKSEVINYLNE